MAIEYANTMVTEASIRGRFKE
jgi:hypothetical protein